MLGVGQAVEQTRKRKKRRRGRIRDWKRYLKTLRVILILSLGTFALYYFSQSSFFELQDVRVSGQHRLSGADITKESGLGMGMNIFRLDLEQATKRLAANPLIESVELKRRFPGTVLVIVKERRPRALLLTKDSFLVIDRKGFCMDKLAAPGTLSLPIITGMDVRSAELGKQVSRDHGLELILAALDGDVQNFFSEFHLAESGEIIAYSRDGLPFLMGTADNLPEKFSLAGSITDNLYDLKAIEYVDIRAVQAPAIKYLGTGT